MLLRPPGRNARAHTAPTQSSCALALGPSRRREPIASAIRQRRSRDTEPPRNQSHHALEFLFHLPVVAIAIVDDGLSRDIAILNIQYCQYCKILQLSTRILDDRWTAFGYLARVGARCRVFVLAWWWPSAIFFIISAFCIHSGSPAPADLVRGRRAAAPRPTFQRAVALTRKQRICPRWPRLRFLPCGSR